ncbi:MAG: glycosyltransferase [Rhodospirillaceae bacterium]
MKLLFYSPHTLFDSSSGAALCVATLLGELKKQGHSCLAVTGSVVDTPNPLIDRALSVAPASAITVTGGDLNIPIRRVAFHDVAHIMAGNGWTPGGLRAVEDTALRQFFLDAFADFEPDVLLTYGGYVSNYYAGQHALAKGRRSVLYAASPSYLTGLPHAFDHVNMVHTVSHAMRERLNAVTSLPVFTTRTFVRREDALCAKRRPTYVTFVNPIPEKGLKIAAALVRECHRLKKPYKFLFIEGRGTRESVLAACPELAGLDNFFTANNTFDPRRIYEQTAAILYPSLWFEPAGRIPLEANMNGIPVLASRTGGIPQMLDGAGFLFDVPEKSRIDHMAEVSTEDIAAWIATLDRLHGEQDFMDDAVARARAADARYDTAGMARDFVNALRLP